MSIAPIITFKAGICEFNDSTNPPFLKLEPTPGYIYLYSRDELVHFCWRPCSASLDEPKLDLVLAPSDGSFTPYKPIGKGATNGRVFQLMFSSSSQRYLFWMHPQSQHENGDLTWFSARDMRLGEIVDLLLKGEEEVDVEHEIANLPHQPFGSDNDEIMESVGSTDHNPSQRHGNTNDGTGPGAAEGGLDDVQAAGPEALLSLIQDLLNSLGGGQSQFQSGDPERPFATLQDLHPFPTDVNLPTIDSLDETKANWLLESLAPRLHRQVSSNADAAEFNTDAEMAQAALLSLDLAQKKTIIRDSILSPKFRDLINLAIALKYGGLPSISEALQIPVANGGLLRQEGVPLRGGDAVGAFIDGVRQVNKKT